MPPTNLPEPIGSVLSLPATSPSSDERTNPNGPGTSPAGGSPQQTNPLPESEVPLLRLLSMGMPERLARMSLRRMQPRDAEDRKNLDTLRMLTGVPQNEWPLLLLLTGSPGTGKTHAAARLFMWWTTLTPTRGLWTSEYLLTQSLKFPQSNWWAEWKTFTHPALLVVDDLFTEKTSEADVAHLVELIEHRKNSATTTILTTNRSIIDIEERYSVRLAERLMEDTVVLLFQGESRRMGYDVSQASRGPQVEV